jgi:peptidoglycan-N-acetylglucosamine deacetylase
VRVLYLLGASAAAALACLWLGRTGRWSRQRALASALGLTLLGVLSLAGAVLPFGNWYGPTVTNLRDLPGAAPFASEMYREEAAVPGQDVPIALTFDDGPYAPFTRELLAVLRQHRTHATFFLVASQAERHPELVRQIVAEGHTVGIHAYRHQDYLKLNQEKKRADLTHAKAVLERLTGRRITYWRPPHGFRDPAVMALARELGLTVVTWDVVPRDWTGIPAQDIVQRVLDRAQPGAIVLLHDGDSPFYRASRQPTVDAVGPLLEALRRAGYRPVSLEEAKRGTP